MTDADKATNPQHLGSDAADIRIRNNREIRIRIPDDFRLTALPEFALSECFCVITPPRLADLCYRYVCHPVVLLFCKQDNSPTR